MGSAKVQSHGEKIKQQHLNEAVYSSELPLIRLTSMPITAQKIGLQPCSLGNQVPWVTEAANAEKNP